MNHVSAKEPNCEVDWLVRLDLGFLRSLGIFLLGFMLSFCLNQTVKSQEKLLDLLPYEEELVFWTNDFPSLLAQIQDLRPNNVEDWSAAVGIAGGSTRNESQIKQRFSRHRLRQLTEASNIWQQLESDEIFDGEAGMVVLPLGSPSRNAFVAHSSASEAEIRQLMKSLEILLSPVALADEIETEFQSQWEFKSGWLCISADDDLRERMLDHLGGIKTAKISLADDRAFQRCFRRLKETARGRSGLSFYATAGSLPYLGELIQSQTSLFFGIDSESWDAFYLNSMRGLGASIYFGDSDLRKQTGAAIGIDAFAVVSQPRRGALRSFGVSKRSAIEELMPTPNIPIARYKQVQLDGPELHLGVIEATKNRARLQGETDEEVLNQMTEDSPDIGLMKYVGSVVEIVFANEVENSEPLPRQLGIQVSDPEAFRDIFSEMAAAEFELRPLTSFDGGFRDLDFEDAYGWGRTEASVEENRQAFVREMEQLKQQLAELEEKSEAEMQLPEYRIARQQLDDYERYVRQLTGSDKPIMVTIGEWFFGDGDNEYFYRELARGWEEKHPQIEQLSEDLEKMKQHFASQEPNLGVIALWGDVEARKFPTANSTASPKETSRPMESSRDPSLLSQDDTNEKLEQEIFAAKSRQFEQVSSLTWRQFERVVIAVSSSSDGLRLNAIVIQDPDGEAGEWDSN